MSVNPFMNYLKDTQTDAMNTYTKLYTNLMSVNSSSVILQTHRRTD